MLWADRMLRRLAKMWLMVEDSWKVHATVKVLLLPAVGVQKSGELHMELKTDSWSTSTANYRSESVMVMTGLMKLTSCRMMLTGHFTF